MNREAMYEALAARFGGLWRHADFRALWASLTITHFGSQFTLLALPLAAALLLDATPLQVGILTAFEALPFALFSLFAGVLVDRSRKLPLVIGSDIGRGMVLLLVPFAAWFDMLSMPLLYAVGFLAGTGGVIGWAAYQVLMTERIGRANLMEANAKMALSESGAQLVGPGMAGVAIQWLTAPVAILFDALSFFASAWLLRGLPPSSSDAPRHAPANASIWRDIADGLRAIRDNAVLRSIAWSVALWNILRHIYLAVVILYAARVLALSPGAIGAAWMGGGVGCIVASFVATRANRRYGMGVVMLAGLFLTGIAWGLIGIVRADSAETVFLLAAGIFAFDLGGTLFFINYLTLRQTLTPDALLGRVTSTMIFLTVALAPLGSLAGGLLGGSLGLRETMWIVAACGILLGLVLLRVSPLPALRRSPV